MAADLVKTLPQVQWQSADSGLQSQMHRSQELARFVVEVMGNAAAVGFLGLQELTGEVLQPRLPRLHFSVELSIGKGGGGVSRKEAHQRQGLGIKDPPRPVPEAERADLSAVVQEWQGQ